MAIRREGELVEVAVLLQVFCEIKFLLPYGKEMCKNVEKIAIHSRTGMKMAFKRIFLKICKKTCGMGLLVDDSK